VTKKEIYRNSRQRNRILNLLRSRDDHPDADLIYRELKKEFPRLSMGNVYRNLNILVKQRRIHRIKLGSGSDRYDAVMDHHYHFICESCHSVMDVELPPQDRLNEQAAQLTGCTVTGHQIRFFGLCPRCQSHGDGS